MELTLCITFFFKILLVTCGFESSFAFVVSCCDFKMLHYIIQTIVIISSILIYNQMENFLFKTGEERTHYTAAVVEYQPEGSPWTDTGPQVIAKNLRNYLSYIQNASR